MIIKFGKYKGQRSATFLKDIKYVHWLAQQPTFAGKHPQVYALILKETGPVIPEDFPRMQYGLRHGTCKGCWDMLNGRNDGYCTWCREQFPVRNRTKERMDAAWVVINAKRIRNIQLELRLRDKRAK